MEALEMVCPFVNGLVSVHAFRSIAHLQQLVHLEQAAHEAFRKCIPFSPRPPHVPEDLLAYRATMPLTAKFCPRLDMHTCD